MRIVGWIKDKFRTVKDYMKRVVWEVPWSFLGTMLSIGGFFYSLKNPVGFEKTAETIFGPGGTIYINVLAIIFIALISLFVARIYLKLKK